MIGQSAVSETSQPASNVSGARIVEVDETPSTNSMALQLAAQGERGPLWITARRQTAGRGRSGRAWVSLDGNLFATLLMTPDCSLAEATQLSLVAGVAVVEAVRQAVGPADIAGLRLKWPNDILVGQQKLGGILIESISAQGAAPAVAVGIGLNLVGHPGDAGRLVTHLGAEVESGASLISRDAVLAQLAREMAVWVGHWREGRGFSLVRAAWLERAGPVGERMSVNTGSGVAEGRFQGLDETGALILADGSGREQRFTFGDVTLLDKSGSASVAAV
jgi:BirA family biotin operon repressor/biotin-[acetyl-CoA-carboxylase] ligase